MNRIKNKLSGHGRRIKEHGNKIKHHSKKIKDHVVKHATSSPPHPYFVYSVILLIAVSAFIASSSHFDFSFDITGKVTDFGGLATEENTSNPSDYTEWSSTRRTLNGTALYPRSLGSSPVQLWNMTINESLSTVVVASNGTKLILYTTGSGSNKEVYAIDATTGASLWNSSTGRGGKPSVSGNMVFTSGNSRIYATNASNGSEIWNFNPAQISEGNPIVWNNTVFVGSNNKKMYALNASNGNQLWSFQTGGYVRGSAAVVGGIVYFGSENDTGLFAVYASNGSQIWNLSGIGNSGFTGSSPIVADDGVLYIGPSWAGVTYAINATNGSQIWNFSSNGEIASAAYKDGIVYVTEYNIMHALNATNGSQIWNFTKTGLRFWGDSPTVSNNMVIVGTLNNTLYALNLTTGTQIFNYSVDNTIKSHSIAIANDTVFFKTGDDNGDGNSTVYALRLALNTPANIAVIKPPVNLVSDSFFGLNWTANDTDNTTPLQINCYGDTDNSGNDKILTCFENETNNGVRNCDTSSWPAGQTFSPWCSVYDGTDYTYSYASGNITVQHNTSWIQRQSDAMHTGYSTSSIPDNSSLITLWNYTVGGFVLSPVVKNGIVVATSNNNKTYAFNTSTGAIIWNRTINGSDYVPSAVIGNGIVYISASGSAKTLHALNLTNGNEIWNFTHTDSIQDWGDTIDGNTLYINTWQKIYAFNTTSNTNTTLWNISPPSGRFNGAPAIYNNMLFVGSFDVNQTYAYNLTTHGLIWNSTTGTFGLESGASVSNGIIYFSTSEGDRNANTTFALNATNGNILWSFPVGSRPGKTPVVYNNTVFFRGEDNIGNFYAVYANNGTQKWNMTGSASEDPPAIADGRIFGGLNGRFWIININGTVIRNGSSADGISLAGDTIVAENKVFFTTNGAGSLFVLGANNLPTVSEVNFSVPVADNSFTVNWLATDADNNSLKISCYGDENNISYVKATKCFENIVNNGSATCDTSAWPSGQLFNIWCQADDQTNVSNSIGKAYAIASGKISIQHNSSWIQHQSDSMHTGVSSSIISNATLRRLWNYTIGGFILSPVIKNGIVVATSNNNKTYAFNTSTGAIIWNRTINGSDMLPSAIIDNGVVYISAGGTRKTLHTINITNGNEIWNFTDNNSWQNWPDTLDGNMLYVNSVQKIYAFNTSSNTNATLWSLDPPTASFNGAPAIYNGMLFVGSDNANQTYAYNLTNRQLVWNQTTGSLGSESGLSVSNGILYFVTGEVGTNANRTFALNTTNGNYIWNFSIGSRPGITPVIYNNTAFFEGTDNGNFYAVYANNGTPIWNITGYAAEDSFAIADNKIFGGLNGRFWMIGTNGSIIRNGSLSDISLQGDTAIAENKVFFTGPAGDNNNLFVFSANNQPAVSTVNFSVPVSDNSFTVNWAASDADSVDTLLVSCYGDPNNTNYVKATTCFENTANNGSNTCNTGTWPSGQLFNIWCQADDQQNVSNSIGKAYAIASGKISIQHNSSWSQYQSDSMHTGVSTSSIDNSSLVQLWNYTVGGSLLHGPVVKNGIVVVASDFNRTTAFNTTTGSVIWNRTIKNHTSVPSLIIGDGLVYQSGSNGSAIVFAFNLTNGNTVWNYTQGFVSWSQMTLDNGKLYLTRNGAVEVINASSGTNIINMTVPSGSFVGSGAIYDGMFFVGSDQNQTYAYNTTTGLLVWNSTTGGPDFSRGVSVSSGIVYTSTYDNITYALNATNGSKIWTFATNGSSASVPAVYNNTVFFGSGIGFFALNVTSGVQYWNKSIPDSSYGFAITSTDSKIVAPFNGIFYIFSTNGDVIRNDSSPGPQGNLAVAENKVFLVKLGYPPYENSTLMAYGANSVPSIQTLLPSTSQVTDSSFVISWSASDLNNHTLGIGCYADDNNAGSDKILTCFENIANNGSNTCDSSNWPAGQLFYIWCSAADLYNTTNAYAPGNVTIQHNSSWPMFHGDLAHTGLSTSSLGNTSKITRLWMYNATNQSTSSPAVVNDIIYFGVDNGKTYALNATTGAHIWNFTSSDAVIVQSSPAVANGIVYIGYGNGVLYALNSSTGAQLWNYTTGNTITSSPAVANGIVYVGSDDNKTYALNATNGNHIWNYTTLNNIRTSSPAIAKGILYIGSNDNKTYALNATTGVLIWSYITVGNVGSSPTFFNNTIYVGSGPTTPKFQALNALTNSSIWNFSTSGSVVPVSIANGIVYIGADSSAVIAINATNGSQIWNFTIIDAMRSSPTIANGLVAFGSSLNATHILNATNGYQLWNYTLFAPVYSSPAIANGVLYIISQDGMVYAFSADETAPTITASSPSGTITTSSTTLNITTNEVSTCSYSTTAGTAYASMSGTFTDSGTAHTKSLTSLSNGAKTYYARCSDLYGNVNETDYNISFTVSVSSSSSSSSSSGGGGGGGGAVTTTTTTTTCTDGAKQCSGATVQECASNTWVNVKTCENGCESGSCKTAATQTTETQKTTTSTSTSEQSTQTSNTEQTSSSESQEGTSPFGNFVKPDQKTYDQLYDEVVNNQYNKEALDSSKPIPTETKEVVLETNKQESVVIIDPLLPVKEVNFVPEKDATLKITLKREIEPERIVQRPYQYMKIKVLQLIDGKEIPLETPDVQKELGLSKEDLTTLTTDLDITETQLLLLVKDLQVEPQQVDEKTAEALKLTPKETLELVKELDISPKDLTLIKELDVPSNRLEEKIKEVYDISPKELVTLLKDLEVSPKDISTKTEELFTLTPKETIDLVTELNIAPKDLQMLTKELESPATTIEEKIQQTYEVTPTELVYLVKDLETTVKDLSTKTESLGLTIKETSEITKLGVPPSKIQTVATSLGVSPKELLTKSSQEITKALENLNITKAKYGISVGDSQSIEGINLMSDLSNVSIKFSVEKDWLYRKCIKKSWINLARYDEDLKYWKRLPTTIIGENITHVLYEAATPSLSLYAIEAKPLSCMCPPDQEWSSCQNDQSNRISYECSTATGSTCIPKVEKKSCSTGQILNEKKLDEYKPASPEEQKEASGSNLPIIIIAVVGIVGIGVGVGMFALRGKKPDVGV